VGSGKYLGEIYEREERIDEKRWRKKWRNGEEKIWVV